MKIERTIVEQELLDIPGAATDEQIEGNLRDIALANRWLGGTSVVLGHLGRLIGPSPARQPVKILDLASGLGDIPAAIARWAKREGLRIRITAIDKNPTVVRLAREYTEEYPEITIEQADILDLRYPPSSFDVVTCSQIIHHLSNEEVVAVLKSANRLASRGVVVSDLHRRRLCITAARVGASLMPNPISRHDGKVSFRNAFTPEEIGMLAEEAGLPCIEVHFHGPCRLALVSDKRTAIPSNDAKQGAQALAIV